MSSGPRSKVSKYSAHADIVVGIALLKMAHKKLYGCPVAQERIDAAVQFAENRLKHLLKTSEFMDNAE